MTKYKQDLRRIIGIDDGKASEAEDLKTPGGIESTRVIAQQTGGGVSLTGTPTTTTTSDDSTKDDSDDNNSGLVLDDVTLEEYLEDQAQQQGNTANGGPTSYSDTAGVESAADVIDNKAGPDLLTNNPTIFDGSFSSSNTLKGITAIDCDTSKELNLRLDGLFAPVPATTYDDGSEKTPEWTDPNTPPDKIGYQDGYYWEVGGSGNPSPEQSSTPDDAAQLAADYLDGASPSEAPHTIIGKTVTATDGGGNPTIYDFEYSRAVSSNFTLPVSRIDCIVTPPDLGSSCPASAPTYTQWPDDDKISLTYQDGIYVSNQYDGDVTTQYTENNSFINFCMDGGRTGTIEAGINGGHLLYETDNGAPTGIIRYYDSQGNLAGFSDVAGMDIFRPKELP